MKSFEETRTFFLSLAFTILLNAPVGAVHLEPTPLPDAPGILNVKRSPYFAKGDGTTDDTKAIVKAIQDGISYKGRYGKPKIVYLPKGTYRITDSLWARVKPDKQDGGWLSGSCVFGEGVNETVIKLDDNHPKFQDPKNPFPIFRTGSEKFSHNRAFRHAIFNLTIDIGAGNPGAIGVCFLVSNRGAISNVRVQSSDSSLAGHTGIEIDKGAGPGMIEDVEIIGLDYGITTRGAMLGMTLENITLRHQTICGIQNDKNALYVRNLHSTNTVPAYRSIHPLGHSVIVDARLTGGNDSLPALFSTDNLLLRTITTQGYKTALATNDGPAVSENQISAYVSRPAFSLFDSGSTQLDLPVEETPYYHPNDLESWVSVTEFGATPAEGRGHDDDDASAIQKAIDSGKEVVYLPHGSYSIGSTIVIRGRVQKIVGLMAELSWYKDKKNGPLIRFADGSSPFVILEHLRMHGDIEHDSRRDLVLSHLDIGDYWNTSEASGKLFIEDIIGGSFTFRKPHRVWARQLNTEREAVHVHNDGTTFWVLGLKTEGYGTIVKTTSGGASEVLGCMSYPSSHKKPDVPGPAFLVDNARFSGSWVEHTYNKDRLHRVFVMERQGEKRSAHTSTLGPDDFPGRGNGRIVLLYNSAKAKSEE